MLFGKHLHSLARVSETAQSVSCGVDNPGSLVSMKIALVGATGRLGKVIDDVISGMDDAEVVARLHSTSALAEMDGADLVIDATNPAISAGIVSHALASGAKVLVGTSGWDSGKLESLASELEGNQGVVVIPNFSVGAMVSELLAKTAATFFDSIEVIEAHHANKADAPSGTAVHVAEVMANARTAAGLEPVVPPTIDQPGRGVAVSGIAIHALRLKGINAKQEVVLAGDGETITITHDTISPDSYKQGIAASIRFAAKNTGLSVGLGKVLGVDA